MKSFFAIALVLVVGCKDAQESNARVTRITERGQLIGGPGALGDIGDYLIENDKIRVIVHGLGPNRGSLPFAGTIIDADLQRTEGQGFDALAELAPAFFLESFEPHTFEVVADGSQGGDAVLRVIGEPAEFLETATLLNQALLFPAQLEYQVDYILSPGSSAIEIKTTVRNLATTEHPFPFLSGMDLVSFGLEVPGIENLELSSPMGSLLRLSGKTSTFASKAGGFNVRLAIEDSYADAPGLPAFPGLLAELVGGKGNRVSYGLFVLPDENNYVAQHADLYVAQKPGDSDMVLPFQFADSVGVFYASPPAVLQGQEEFSFRSFLAVGNGDMASVTRAMLAKKETETGRFTGRLMDKTTGQGVANGAVVVQRGDEFVTQAGTDGQGYFVIELPAGEYQFRTVTSARVTPPATSLTVSSGETVFRRIELPGVGRVTAAGVDEQGRRPPCRLTLVGQHDGNTDAPRRFLYDLAVGESVLATDFEPGRNLYEEAHFFSADCTFSEAVRPGMYTAYLSRGPEYEFVSQEIEIQAGSVVHVEGILERAFPWTGYAAADFHLHGANSPDSDLPNTKRVVSVAAEGIQFGTATDHNYVTDYQAAIIETGIGEWFQGSAGIELTSFEMGHFNGYPLERDPGSIRGGELFWSGFTPDELFEQIRAAGPSPEETFVQVNHGRDGLVGYFAAFGYDQETGAPAPAEGLGAIFRPPSDTFGLDKFSLNFDAMELLSGRQMNFLHSYRTPDPIPPEPLPDDVPIVPGEIVRDVDGKIAFPGLMEDWFSMLNRGLRPIAIGASDSHGTHDAPGYARTLVWVGEGNENSVTEDKVLAGLRSKRAIATMCPVVEFFVNELPIGQMASGGTAEIRIVGQSAEWCPMDTVLLYRNGELLESFQLSIGEENEFEMNVVDTPGEDAWYVVEVTGSENLFPMVAPVEFPPLNPTEIIEALGQSLDLSTLLGEGWGNLQPAKTFYVTPVAITNPIWLDANGNGEFEPPLSFLESVSSSLDIFEVFENEAAR